MAGGSRHLPGSQPTSVEETMFEILGSLLKDLCSPVGGKDAWNTSLLDSVVAGGTTSKLGAQEGQEGNADVRLVLLLVSYGEGCIRLMAQKTDTSPTHFSSIALNLQGTASLG